MSNVYRFGQFVPDPGRRTLSRSDSPVSLTPKAFDVLLFLAKNPSRLVTKEEWLQSVWADTSVEEGNLRQYISHLRIQAAAIEPSKTDARLVESPTREKITKSPPPLLRLRKWFAATGLLAVIAAAFWLWLAGLVLAAKGLEVAESRIAGTCVVSWLSGHVPASAPLFRLARLPRVRRLVSSEGNRNHRLAPPSYWIVLAIGLRFSRKLPAKPQSLLSPDFDLHLIVDNSAVISRYGGARGSLNNSAILK